mmetsp:Transcript_7383/g.6543  ORF Transcript_7383/g.6543 Transcript_7383/m.6543 type:complete len:150 (+) Transcript_7383:444-893(+)
MEDEIEQIYQNLQEEENLFASDVDKEDARIDTIKGLLLKVKKLEDSKDSIAQELNKKEKMWIKNDEVYKQTRDRLILTLNLEINLLLDILKSYYKIRDVQYKSILYFEQQILFMTKLEMDERRKNLKYYQDAKNVIFEKEQRLYDLTKI